MDAVLLSAVDLARQAAIEVADDDQAVGEHLGATEDETRILTHTFACNLPGYRGWVWAVTVARAPRGRGATLSEAHLVPADDALLAPPWVPWAERIRPGDLEAAMALPKIEEDPRLVPGFEITDEADEDLVEIWELGLGRERMLGPEGRNSAAERWHRGSHGPTAPAALASSEPCSTCAFFVPLSGSLRQAFGACTNEWSPSDGRVVAVDHGCGAHSQTDAEKQSSRWPTSEPVIDTAAADPLVLDGEDDEPASDDAAASVPAENNGTATTAVAEPEAPADVEVAEATHVPVAPAGPGESVDPADPVASVEPVVQGGAEVAQEAPVVEVPVVEEPVAQAPIAAAPDDHSDAPAPAEAVEPEEKN